MVANTLGQGKGHGNVYFKKWTASKSLIVWNTTAHLWIKIIKIGKMWLYFYCLLFIYITTFPMGDKYACVATHHVCIK